MVLKWVIRGRFSTLFNVTDPYRPVMVGQIIKVTGGYDSFDLRGGTSRMMDFQVKKGSAKKVMERAMK